jgi:abscisic-aldehyde oxidase
MLLFALNGERHEISSFDPSMTLLEFIRTQTRFRGPKLGCGEGDSLLLVLIS